MALVVSLVAALVPGVYRWRWSRRFLAAPDDPVQAERWLAYRSRGTYVTLASALVCGALQPATPYIWLPILWLCSAIGGFHVRRAVFGERWSLGSYLAWTLRLVTGVWGFWLLLSLTPWLVTRTSGWWPAAGLAAFLMAWAHWYGPVLIRVLSGRPFLPDEEGPELAAGFRQVLERATLSQPPSIWRAGPAESMLANAVAIPSASRASVLFSNALITSLEAREVAAILGHEIAHLEEFSKKRLALVVTTPALVMLSAFVLPRLPFVSPGLLAAGWPFALVVGLSLRSRFRQHHETSSDRRAVELCGDWRALSSALTGLHALGRIPRRWSVEFERRASHPSLSRRLATLKAIGGAIETPMSVVVVKGRDGTTWVTVESERVRHLKEVPAGTVAEPAALAAAASQAISLSYAEVRELRVVATASGAVLRVGDVTGRAWTCALDPADVARVQAALDSVDHLISHASPRDSQSALVALAGALAIALVGLMTRSTTLAALGALTAVGVSAASVTAAGFGALSLLAGALAGLPWAPRGGTSMLAAVAALGILCVVCGLRWKGAGAKRWWLTPALLVVGTLGVWLIGALLSGSLLGVHRLAHQTAIATALPAALAGALWRTPRWKAWAVVSIILACVPAIAATSWFERTVVRDPLMADMPVLPRRVVELTRVGAGQAPEGAVDLRLTADGRRFIVAIGDDDDEPSGTFVVGTLGGAAETIKAQDVEWVDANNFLVLSQDGTSGALAMRDVLNPGIDRWSLQGDLAGAAELSVDQGSGRWRVIVRSRSELVRVSGRVGTDDRKIARWPLPATGPYAWYVADDGPPLGVERRPARSTLDRLSLAYAFQLGLPSYPGALYTLDEAGTTHLLASSSQSLSCGDAPATRPVHCVANDGATSWLWTFERGRLEARARLDAPVLGVRPSPDGVLIAWVRNRPLLIDPAFDEALEPAAEPSTRYGEWTSNGRSLGVLTQQPDGNRIVTFSRR